MSGPPLEPWSNDPNAPQIPYGLYLSEKENFAGVLLGAVFYGAVVVLFFQCIGSLLNPVNRAKGGIKWGLVALITAMFAFVTIATAINLDLLSVCYVDNEAFPGIGGVVFPGPLGYQVLIYSKAISVVPSVLFLLNTWLADGLLLYRCYVIYAMNHWMVALPFLMYIASIATGIIFTYQESLPTGSTPFTINFGYPYFSVSFSLNVLLTLMIVIRLVLHSRNIRDAVGHGDRPDRLYIFINPILVESCALYAATYVLYFGPWGAGNYAASIFFPILVEIQVIAPFLIILRVANRTALTSNTMASGNIGSIQFNSHGESTGDNGTLPDENPLSSTATNGETFSELRVGVETGTIGLSHDEIQESP